MCDIHANVYSSNDDDDDDGNDDEDQKPNKNRTLLSRLRLKKSSSPLLKSLKKLLTYHTMCDTMYVDG